MQFGPEPVLLSSVGLRSPANGERGVLSRSVGRLGPSLVTALVNVLCAAAAPGLAQPLQWSQGTSRSAGLGWSTTTVQAAQQQPGWRTVVPSPELRATTVVGEPADPAAQQVVTDSTPRVMAMSRGITVNRILYPDVSITVPNGFKRDPQRFLSLSVDATNQIRTAAFTGCRGQSSCPDAEFNAELALLQSGPVSLELLYTVANTVSDANNPNPWSYQQLGFRLAANLSSTLGLAVGGESLINLDGLYAPAVSSGGQQLKGRTLYAVASAAFPMSDGPTPAVLTVTAGAGNGYYGLNSTGVGDDQWGPMGSVSYAFNDRVSVGVEYSGYALSAGLSVRPFKDLPLTASFYATDFVGNVPGYIDSFCPNGSCSTRFLGRFTYSL